MSSKPRIDLKIWPSKAKNLEELDSDVRKSLAPRKSAENNEKPKKQKNTKNYFLDLLTIIDYLWDFLTIIYYFWDFLTIIDYSWL